VQAISMRDITKAYGKQAVLKGVNLEVVPGTIFCLLGTNGAGKTTAINILTTLLSADSGQATVQGFDVAEQSDKVRGCISLTGQFAAVDDVLTARENLLLIAELRHEKQPQQVATALLEQFDLTDAADRAAGTFSGGMRRRLDIAMGLIGNPAVIFLDEPTTGLDPQSRNAMWAAIKELAKSGKTIFLTTQYLEEADQLADTIAVLDKGIIVAQGTPAELKKLLPHGKIVLTFSDQQELDAAGKTLQDYDTTSDDQTLSLTVTTDGSVAAIAKLFNHMQAAQLQVTEFAQKSPTLDDAFLRIIAQNKETN